MDLTTLLAGLVSGVLTVPVVSYLLNKLPDTLDKTTKRIIAIAVSFLLGTGAFILSVYLGYTVEPSPNWQAWVEMLWPVWTAAFTASQAVLSGYKSLVK